MQLIKFIQLEIKMYGFVKRGNSFGYQDLIVDATAITRLKKHGVENNGLYSRCTKSQINLMELLGETHH